MSLNIEQYSDENLQVSMPEISNDQRAFKGAAVVPRYAWSGRLLQPGEEEAFYMGPPIARQFKSKKKLSSLLAFKLLYPEHTSFQVWCKWMGWQLQRLKEWPERRARFKKMIKEAEKCYAIIEANIKRIKEEGIKL